MGVALSAETVLCVMTEARRISGTFFALSAVWMCTDATTSGGDGGGSLSTSMDFLPCGRATSNLHHEVELVDAERQKSKLKVWVGRSVRGRKK